MNYDDIRILLDNPPEIRDYIARIVSGKNQDGTDFSIQSANPGTGGGGSGVILPWVGPGTSYVQGQPVTNGGHTYTSNDVHSSGATFAGDLAAHWTLLPVTKTDVGLSNVDNTSDVNKPVSTAQAAADSAKLAKSSNLSDLADASTARTNLGLGTMATVALDTDDTLAANSDARGPSQKAVKTYVDEQISSVVAGSLPDGAGLTYVQETEPPHGAFPWLWLKQSSDDGKFEISGAYTPPLGGPGPDLAFATMDGLGVWLRSGTIVADGQPQGPWPDSSSNGFDAVAATSDARPIAHTGGPNGMPYLDFDGSTGYLKWTGDPEVDAPRPITRYILTRFPSFSLDIIPVDGVAAGFQLNHPAGDPNYALLSVGSVTYGPPSSGQRTAWNLWTLKDSVDELKMYFNGTQLGTTVSGAGVGHVGGLSLGGDRNGVKSPSQTAYVVDFYVDHDDSTRNFVEGIIMDMAGI